MGRLPSTAIDARKPSVEEGTAGNASNNSCSKLGEDRSENVRDVDDIHDSRRESSLVPGSSKFWSVGKSNSNGCKEGTGDVARSKVRC